MTGFNHGMTGAVLALVIKQPALAVPLAFLSHFVTDMIPHFGLGRENILNRKFTIILVADFIFSIFLMVVLAVLFPAHHLYRVKIKHRKLKLGKIALFHSKIQWSQTLPGIAMEACWFILMGLIILHQIA
jgi:hypothetical protein